MSIVDDLTPTHYKLIRVGVEKDAGGAIATTDMAIVNSSGVQLASHGVGVTLTQEEKQTLIGIVDRCTAEFEAETGLERWVP